MRSLISLFALLYSLKAYPNNCHQYFGNVRNARTLLNDFSNEKPDSGFYHYFQALESGFFSYDDHFEFLRYAFLCGSKNSRSKMLAIAAKTDFTKSDVKLCFSHAQLIANWHFDKNGKKFPILKESSYANFMSTYEFDTITFTSNRIKKSQSDKSLNKLDKLDQKGNRKNVKKVELRDSIIFERFYQLIIQNEGIPKDISPESHEIISVIMMHQSAENLIRVLPYFEEAIQTGSYFNNSDLAYAIERCAIFDGSYIVKTINNGYKVIKDTSFEVNGLHYYPYLGEYYFPNKLKSNYDSKFFCAPINPTISEEQVNLLRSVLCLENFSEHLERNDISIVDSALYRENWNVFFNSL